MWGQIALNNLIDAYFSIIITGLLAVIAFEILVGFTIILLKFSGKKSIKTKVERKRKAIKVAPRPDKQPIDDLEIIDFDEDEFEFL